MVSFEDEGIWLHFESICDFFCYQDIFRLEKIEKKKETPAENVFKAMYVHIDGIMFSG